MVEADPIRVVLLARAGEARDRLGAALADAGAELVLAADPLSTDPRDVAQARPGAVVVALEPAVEDALERFEDVLSDPAVTVLFEEAELAARRAGWDAARWVRHLSAKLRRHDDVLPPGREDERDWQPTPGPLPERADLALDLDSIAGEARTRADAVPRDENLDTALAPLAFTDDLDSAVFDADAGDDHAVPAARTEFDAVALVDADALFASLAARSDDGEQDDTSGDEAAAAPPAAGRDWSDSTLSLAADDDAAAPLAASGATQAPNDWSDGGLTLADADDATPLAVANGEHSEADWSDGGLRLADDDAPMPTVAADADARAPERADALAERASSLSLVDTDSYGHGPARGAVLIEAGLGGPDAVRQLLAALPATFPRAVLVRLQLDGGRYDRLVAQMARIAKLPVALAEAGQLADAGTIYFLPGDLGLERHQGQLRFVAGAADVLDALPDEDSAHLFLSGSQPSLVDAALAHMQSGRGLIAAQAPDTCYDAVAASALIAHGVAADAPSALAERLAERWPS
jgi:chemosensory pili system protein ChpB (putative protein-glutamate methylesterase)